MVRKTGSIAFFLCLIGSFAFSSDSQISLFATDLQGEPFEYIETQQPFVLHVNVRNMDGDMRQDVIPGAKTCVVSYGGASQTTSIINGVRDEMVSHQYVVRGKKEGEFTFGPIEGESSNGQKVVSNSVKVIISDTPLVHKSKIEPFFIQSYVDKSTIYLGQKISVTTRFYYRNQHDHLEISEPSYAGCSVVSRSQRYKQGRETIDGNEFFYKEVQTVLYPQEVGNLDFLPARALFTDGSMQRGFWGMNLQKKELISKFLTVDVVPLPEHPDGEKILPIGNFTNVVLNVEIDEHKVGSPVMAQYIIQGEGNFELIASPQVEMPQSMRCYSSTYKIKKMDDGRQEKIFELVIQGSKPGVFTIPKQNFTYFDPEKKKYKTLQTKPVKITFTGEAIEIKPEEKKPEEKDIQSVQRQFNFKDWQIDQIYQGREIHSQQERGISSDLFLKIFISLFLLFLLCLGFIHHDKLVTFLWKHLLAQQALIYFSLFLMGKSKKKKKSQAINQLYALLGFFFKLYGFDIHDEFGIAFLQKIGCTEDQQKNWKEYMNRLVHEVYSQKDNAVKVEAFIIGQSDLYTQARKMFQMFFKQIKIMRKAIR